MVPIGVGLTYFSTLRGLTTAKCSGEATLWVLRLDLSQASNLC